VDPGKQRKANKKEKREISRFEKLYNLFGRRLLLYLKLGNLQRGQDETIYFYQNMCTLILSVFYFIWSIKPLGPGYATREKYPKK
jgi:hypothetical protein